MSYWSNNFRRYVSASHTIDQLSLLTIHTIARCLSPIQARLELAALAPWRRSRPPTANEGDGEATAARQKKEERVVVHLSMLEQLNPLTPSADDSPRGSGEGRLYLEQHHWPADVEASEPGLRLSTQRHAVRSTQQPQQQWSVRLPATVSVHWAVPAAVAAAGGSAMPTVVLRVDGPTVLSTQRDLQLKLVSSGQ